MVLNFILLFSFLICNCSGKLSSLLSSSESVSVNYDSNQARAEIQAVVKNDLGSVVLRYPYSSNGKKYLILDFNIATTKPLNLLKVSFNGVPVEQKYLWLGYNKPLELNWEQYFLPFDDSIELTGFFIHLEPKLNEDLQLLEVAKKDGLKIDVECIERKTGVRRNISFKLGINNGQQFFDLLNNFLVMS